MPFYKIIFFELFVLLFVFCFFFAFFFASKGDPIHPLYLHFFSASVGITEGLKYHEKKRKIKKECTIRGRWIHCNFLENSKNNEKYGVFFFAFFEPSIAKEFGSSKKKSLGSIAIFEERHTSK